MKRNRVVAALVSVLALVAGVLLAAPAVPAAAATSGPELVSFTPFRAADTRDGTGVRVGVVPARGVLEVPVAGRSGVPADAAAVVLNVAAVTPAAGGHLTVWPCGTPRPTASTLNFPAGRTVANMALAVPGSDGKVCVYTHATTHLIMDVSGYWPKGSAFTGRVPVRAADTRDGTGVPAGIVPARSVLTVPVAGKYGVPADAAAVAVNVAAVTPAAGGHLTVWPCGAARPTASNVNYVAGETTADAVVVKPGTGGAVCVYTFAATHVILDVVGHLAASSAFTAMVPVRVADTRYGTGVPAGRVAARGTLVVPVAGRFGVPTGAAAVSLTVTAVTPTAGGHLTVYPCGDPRPTASNVNYVVGRTMAAAAIARLGDGGSLCVYTHAATDVIVDVNGHYATSAVGPGIVDIDGNCALMPGGYVKCWPDGTTSQVPGIVGATAISGNCAIVAGGAVQCWDPQFTWTVPGISGATALAVSDHACAVVAGGAVQCWGPNSEGQLGGSDADGQPVTVPGVTGAVSVAVGGGYDYDADVTRGRSCALLATGEAICWGAGTAPAAVPGIRATSMAVSYNARCFVLSTGVLDCLGTMPQLTGVASVAAHSLFQDNRLAPDPGSHFCAQLTDGAVRCAGDNVRGQLGDGTTTASPSAWVTPRNVTGAVAVATAWARSCALDNRGAVTCWGHIPALQSQPVPATVGSLAGVQQLAAAGDHSCALVNGEVKCWGGNSHLELAGEGGDRYVPSVAPGVTGATAVDAGDWSTCAVTSAGRALCWGNRFDFEFVPLYWGPSPVMLPETGVLQAVPEDQGSRVCLLQTGGKVVCNDGLGSSALVPTGATALSAGGATCAVVNGGVVCADGARPLPAGSGVTSIAMGSSFGCVVTGGTVKCWGDNSVGQLGDGTTTSRAAPAPVLGISTATAVAAGGHHACALLSDRTVQCWGSNEESQLGDRSTTTRTRPVAVVGLTAVASIAAADSHTCSTMTDRTVKCWGSNREGRSGSNPGWLPAWQVPGL